MKGNSSVLRKGRFSEVGRIYLVTFTTEKRLPLFSRFDAARVMSRVLRRESRYTETLAYVVMPDHVHWLLQIKAKSLSATVQTVKSVSAHELKKIGTLKRTCWQDGFHDHALRSDEDLQDVARYVIMNPVRAGLVKTVREYPYWDAVWI